MTNLFQDSLQSVRCELILWNPSIVASVNSALMMIIKMNIITHNQYSHSIKIPFFKIEIWLFRLSKLSLNNFLNLYLFFLSFGAAEILFSISWEEDCMRRPNDCARHLSFFLRKPKQKYAKDEEKFISAISCRLIHFDEKIGLPVKGLVILKELSQSLQKKTELPGNRKKEIKFEFH